MKNKNEVKWNLGNLSRLFIDRQNISYDIEKYVYKYLKNVKC